MKNLITTKPVLAYSILAYLITWSIQIPELIAMGGDYQLTDRYLLLLNIASYGPSVAALIITFFSQGLPGIKTLLKRLIQWKVSWLIYLFVFFLFPLLLFTGYRIIGIQPAPGENLFELFLTLVILAPVNALVGSILLDIGPMGEELGWRGFMLPRLLQKYDDTKASVILGLIWAFWHLPTFLFPEWRGEVPIWLAVALYPISTIAIAFVMTKLHHWSHGSVLIAMLYHGIVNYAAGYIQVSDLWGIGHIPPVALELILIGFFVIMALLAGLISWIKKRRTR